MEKQLYEEWIKAIKKHQIIRNITFVCNLHFDPKSMVKINGKMLLKHGTVPSIFTNKNHINSNIEEDVSLKLEPVVIEEGHAKDTFQLVNVDQIIQNAATIKEEANQPGQQTQQVKSICNGCADRDFEINKLKVEVRHRNKLIQYWKSLALQYKCGNNDPFPDMISTTEQMEETVENNRELDKVTNTANDVDLIIENEKSSAQDRLLKPYKCGRCNETFETPKELEHHMRSINEKPKIIIKETKETKFGKRAYECYLCKKAMPSLLRVQRHVENHSKQKITKMKHCTVCFKSFVLSKIDQHLCTQEMEICCEYCTQSFTSTYRLLDHLDSRHMDATLYPCTKCTKHFSMMILKDVHERCHDKVIICEICSESFSRRIEYLEHKKTHDTEKSETAYLCEICGKESKTRDNLSQHRKVHNEPKFKCPDCPQVFRFLGGLKRHSYVHGNNAPQICKICGAKLASPSGLKKHIRNVHKGSHVDCEICHKKIKRNSLRHHMKSHSNIKSFQCEYCPQKYKYNGDLNKHLRIHLGENIHRCNQCPERFRLPIELQRHSFTHYKEKPTI
ncbi:zinc finger protein 184-like [Contarinia nasturtii]|uniref:zinc finger protein 184-like n=1 Tax=Contarinia nasturtii TaxID=265458 RepID=UPI0012D499B4|nr:zinc finger protein 184-like [Contarinia nasturtii]